MKKSPRLQHWGKLEPFVQALKIIRLIAVLLAACILGNWYLAEYKKARAAHLPSYRAYFSLPGILIIVLVLLLPLLARMIQK
jgi:hypothetical protein